MCELKHELSYLRKEIEKKKSTNKDKHEGYKQEW